MDGPTAASSSNSIIARLGNLFRGWQQRFGLDLRALALFRILLGLLLLVDLAARLTDLRVFYSDAGVLPRVDLLGRVATSSTPWLVSLHMVSGLWGVQLLLFATAAYCAFCLVIGHRTRLFTFLSWVLLVSLHNRNLTILNAGDLLFRVLLFWSLFLPLGARCSVDAAVREPARDRPEKGSDRTWSVPAFCFMAQVTILYWATALLKNHPVWTGDRTAVWYALQLDYMALPLAVLMRELPAAWLELMTRTTLHVEFLVPVLIWIPFLVGPLRLAACIVMIGMHLAFAATLQIGLFSYICSAMWLALLPPWVWDRLFARFRRDKERLGMTIHYDADCGFCRRMVLLLRSFFLLPETRIAEAQDDAEIEKDMRTRNSWVVTDSEGNRRFKFEAFAWVLSQSPWAWPAGKILGMAAFRRPGTWLYEQTANRRELMGRLTGWMRPRRERQVRRPLVWLRNGFLLASLAYILLWNARIFHNKEVFAADSVASKFSAASAGWIYSKDDGEGNRVDRRWYGRLLRVGQSWQMFAPYPPRIIGWYVVVGTLEDGSQVDLYRHVVFGEESPEVSWDRPDRLVERFRGPRWRKYMMSLRKKEKKDYRPLLCKYLAREWKREFGDAAPLTLVELFFNEERTRAYEPNTEPKKRRLWYYTP